MTRLKTPRELNASQLARERQLFEPTVGGRDGASSPHGRVYGVLAREVVSPESLN